MPDTTLESGSATNVTQMLCGVPQTMLWTLHNRATRGLEAVLTLPRRTPAAGR